MGQVVDGGANLQGVLLRNLKNYPIAVSWSCDNGAENAAVAQDGANSPVSVCVLPQGNEPLLVVRLIAVLHVESGGKGRRRRNAQKTHGFVESGHAGFLRLQR